MGALERKPGGPDNWVEKVGGLPAYIERIAKSLHEKRGFTISRSIATAVSMCKRWAAGGEDVNPDTRAKAAKAVAEWEAKKARAHVDMSNLDVGGIDLAAMSDEDALDLAYGDHRPPYDWKHGYLPISPQAARIKAKREAAPRGNRGGSSTATVASRSIKKAAAAKKATAPKRKPAVAGRPAERTPAQRKAADDAQRGRGVPGADTGSSRPASTPGVRGLMRAELGSGDPTPAQRTAARDELSKMTPEQLRALRDGTSSTEVSNEVTGELAKRQRAAVTGSRGDSRDIPAVKSPAMRAADRRETDRADAYRRASAADAPAADRRAQDRAIERKDYVNADGPALADEVARRGIMGRERAGGKSDSQLRTALRDHDKNPTASNEDNARARAATPPAKPSLRDRLGGETADLDTPKQKAADMREADITRVNRLAGQGDAAAIAEQKRRQTPAYKRAKAKADQEANGRYLAGQQQRRDTTPPADLTDTQLETARAQLSSTAPSPRHTAIVQELEKRGVTKPGTQGRAKADPAPSEGREAVAESQMAGMSNAELLTAINRTGAVDSSEATPEQRRRLAALINERHARAEDGRLPKLKGKTRTTKADGSELGQRSTGGRSAGSSDAGQTTTGRSPDQVRAAERGADATENKRLARVLAEQRAGNVTPPLTGPPDQPKALTPEVVSRMSDDQLERALDRLAEAGDYSSPAFKAVEAEQNKRDDARSRSRAEGNRPRR